jgi:hypothetical protein
MTGTRRSDESRAGSRRGKPDRRGRSGGRSPRRRLSPGTRLRIHEQRGAGGQPVLPNPPSPELLRTTRLCALLGSCLETSNQARPPGATAPCSRVGRRSPVRDRARRIRCSVVRARGVGTEAASARSRGSGNMSSPPDAPGDSRRPCRSLSTIHASTSSRASAPPSRTGERRRPSSVRPRDRRARRPDARRQQPRPAGASSVVRVRERPLDRHRLGCAAGPSSTRRGSHAEPP